MSEAARARERLDFEAAAETIERGKLGLDLSQQFKGILPTAGMQFTSGGGEVRTVRGCFSLLGLARVVIFVSLLIAFDLSWCSDVCELQVEAVKAEDLTMKKLQPKREEFQWRPSPILCKRFDISDPYMGKVFCSEPCFLNSPHLMSGPKPLVRVASTSWLLLILVFISSPRPPGSF